MTDDDAAAGRDRLSEAVRWLRGFVSDREPRICDLCEAQGGTHAAECHVGVLLASLASGRPRAGGEPTPTDLIRELRDALGLPNGARPDSPQTVWRETLAYVRRLRALYHAAAATPSGTP